MTENNKNNNLISVLRKCRRRKNLSTNRGHLLQLTKLKKVNSVDNLISLL